MATINYKYKRTQSIFYIGLESIPYESQCSVCLGEGTLTRADQSKVTCPTCKGKKVVSEQGAIKHQVFTGKIESIHIIIGEDGTDIVYVVNCERDNRTKDLDESELFDNAEVARVEAERRGKGCIMGYTR